MLGREAIMELVRRLVIGAAVGAFSFQVLSIAAALFVQFRLIPSANAVTLTLGAFIGALVWGRKARPVRAALACFALVSLVLAPLMAYKLSLEQGDALRSEGLLYARAVLLYALAAGGTAYVSAIGRRRLDPCVGEDAGPGATEAPRPHRHVVRGGR